MANHPNSCHKPFYSRGHSLKLAKAIDQFVDYIKRDYSTNTLRSHSRRPKPLAHKLGSKKLTKLSFKHIAKWIDDETHWGDGRTKAPDTIRLTIIAWEQLQKYLMETEILSDPIYVPGQKPGGRRRTRLPTKLEQARIFREALRSRKREFATIFRCLRLCGARLVELVAANITDYKRDHTLIVLANHKTAKKTGEPRRIGVGHVMARILKKEIGDRETGPIFRDERGQPWKVGKLSHIYSQLRNRLEFSRELVLYCARHEHGT